MLTENTLREFVEDSLRRAYPAIATEARARIIARHLATEFRVALDSDFRAGLLQSLFTADRAKNPDDWRVVPLPSELLAAESARLEALGLPPSPEDRLNLYRQYERLNELERIEAADALNLKPQGDAPAPVETAAPTSKKRVIDMSAAEVEAEIDRRWGPAPATGRLGSTYRKFRAAMIEAERSGPTPQQVREIETAKQLETQRELSPIERMRAFRAAQ